MQKNRSSNERADMQGTVQSYLKGNQQFKSLAYSVKALATVTDKVLLSDKKTGKLNQNS
jgi:hypothetical protein